MTEKTSTRALTGIRQMTVPIPAQRLFYDVSTGDWEFQTPDTQWQVINPSSGTFGYHTYVDTSGYNMDELTIMFDSIGQLGGGRTSLSFLPNTRILFVDLVTTQSLGLNPADWDTICEAIRLSNIYPGSPNSEFDFEHIQYGRVREFLPVTQGTTLSDVYAAISDDQFGSLSATTADKLHCYRFVILTGFLPGENAPTFYIPETRFVMNTNIVKEDDIPYLYRQKRSFELQQ